MTDWTRRQMWREMRRARLQTRTAPSTGGTFSDGFVAVSTVLFALCLHMSLDGYGTF